MKTLLVPVLLFSMAGAWSQPRQRSFQPALIPASNLVGIFHAFPTHSPDSSQCIVGYRVVIGDLLFRQRSTATGELVAYYTATIELRDTLGVVRYARVFRDSVFRRTLPDRLSPDAVANMDTITLANGTYTISVDITQEQRQRMLWQSGIVLGSSPELLASASLAFATTLEHDARICLEPWGGVIPFGTRWVWSLCAVPRSWSGRDELTVQARLVRQYYPFYRGQDTVVVTPPASDNRSIFAYPIGVIEPDVQQGRACIALLPSNQLRLVEALLDLRRAIPGEYVLDVIRPTTRDTLHLSFRIQWFAPPVQLFQSRYALAVMQYVLTDDEYRTLADTPDSDRVAAIIRWWQSQDPTPATRYNEAMVEYFRRALQARSSFATATESDGALTERGKIFILFGAPSHVETDLEPGKPGNEIWYYTNAVRKRFTFEVSQQGRYRLRKIESL
ncbi:MAG: GWxTD domain-containing protein [Chlorobiota bacterium]|nr:MAG: GWxTD domain-containing protein [Chlorobiota bacterium]